MEYILASSIFVITWLFGSNNSNMKGGNTSRNLTLTVLNDPDNDIPIGEEEIQEFIRDELYDYFVSAFSNNLKVYETITANSVEITVDDDPETIQSYLDGISIIDRAANQKLITVIDGQNNEEEPVVREPLKNRWFDQCIHQEDPITLESWKDHPDTDAVLIRFDDDPRYQCFDVNTIIASNNIRKVENLRIDPYWRVNENSIKTLVNSTKRYFVAVRGPTGIYSVTEDS